MKCARAIVYSLWMVALMLVGKIMPAQAQSPPPEQSPAQTSPAQTRDQNLTECYDSDESTNHPDAVIAACTALIQSGQESSENLSNIYANRGDAYENKNLDDQAIADWRAALKLDPFNHAAAIGLAAFDGP